MPPGRAQEEAGGPLSRVLAVDGTGVLVRCHRAAQRSQAHLTSSDGTPTGTVMMLIGALSRRIRTVQPGYVVIAWDGPHARDWRREIYPGYKAARPAAPGDRSHSRLAEEFCEAAGIRQLMVPGFEADDLLAAVQRQARAEMPGAPLDFFSDDADVLQLLDESAMVMGMSSEAVITAGDVLDSWGVPPRWLPMLRALSGDDSDGIPGLPQVGPVRALRMIEAGMRAWPLPESVLPDPVQRDQVAAWKSVMDLVDPPRRPEDDAEKGYFALSGQAEWHSELSPQLGDFLKRHELRRLHERMLNGRLW
jgi:5'-3' exonuclease